MRVAHWSIWGPNKCGMYHTTKDIVEAQNALGLDTAFIDPLDPNPKTDGQFKLQGHHWADTADIYMLHLTIPEPYMSDGTPLIVALHGHPLYSMQTELYGLEQGNPAPFSTIITYFNRTEPTWFVSLWKEDQGDYWDAIDGLREVPRIRYVPRGIAFGDRWSPEGPKRDLEGDPVIVICDQFRYYKDALPSIWGAYHYWLRNPKARVYLYGMPPSGCPQRATLESWLAFGSLHRCVGQTNDIVDYLPEVYRAADVLLTTATCESRVVVEAQACGCAVAAPWPEGADVVVDRFWRPNAVADAIEEVVATKCKPADRAARAKKVRQQFDIRKTAQALKSLYEEILG